VRANRRGEAAEMSRKGHRGAKGAHKLRRHGKRCALVARRVYTIFRVCQEVNAKFFRWLGLAAWVFLGERIDEGRKEKGAACRVGRGAVYIAR